MLCLAGADDRSAPPAVMQQMASRIPRAEYRCLEGVGHLAHMEAPQAVNPVLVSFSSVQPVRLAMADLPSIAGDVSALTAQQRELLALASSLGRDKFAPRAARWDREASFPFDNYADLRDAGLLGICVPKAHGGLGADFATYVMVAAELGRHCGSTALSYNMHVCSTLWAGAIADALDMTAEQRADHERIRRLHFGRIVGEGRIYSQPFSEGGAAAAGKAPWGTRAIKVEGGYRVVGKKIFASLSGAADYYGVLCTLEREDGEAGTLRDSLYLAVPANAEGVAVSGEWDPLGMRGTSAAR